MVKYVDSVITHALHVCMLFVLIQRPIILTAGFMAMLVTSVSPL